MDNNEDALRRIYAQLKVISDNPPLLPDEGDAERLSELVDQLSALGYEVDDFRLRDRDFVHEMSGWNTVSQELIYSQYRNVRPDVYKNKVDALLIHFDLGFKATTVTFNAPHRH